MYRTSHVPTRGEDAPRAIVYDPARGSVAAWRDPGAGWGGVAARVRSWIASWTRSDELRLTIEDGYLVVARANGAARRVSLARMRDVEVDVRDASNVPRSPADMLTMASPYGSELSRITLAMDDGARIPLTQEYFPHALTLGARSAIRTYLRARGWCPDDERAE